MYDNIPKTNHHIENSFHLIDRLNGIKIDDNFTFISLDIISLFTNIPIDLAIDCVNENWHFISKGCTLPKEEFMSAVRFVLDSTFFKFNDAIYKQNFGTPMGSPLSPVVVDLVLQSIEMKALRNLCTPVLFYYRYVDDVAMAVPSVNTDSVLNIFNSFHSRIQFTMEMGGNKLNFLDVTLIKNGNTIDFDWYHKPTFSGRYLNFLSQHPISQKRSTVFGLTDRSFLLSHPQYHLKNLNFIINLLLDNNYPLKFIFDNINLRLRNLIRKQNSTQNHKDPSTQTTKPR